MSIRAYFWLSLLLSPADGQTVTHRWTFNGGGAATHGTVIPDEITGAPAVIVGAGATRSTTGITLPGTSAGNVAATSISAYLDLPNGILSSKSDATLEIWATPLSAKNWQRLFDFGSMNIGGTGEVGNHAGPPGAGTNSRDNFMLSLCRGTNLSQQRMAGRLAGAAEQAVDSNLATTSGTRYHYVVTYQSGIGAHAATGGRMTWYRNGTLAGTTDLSFRLSQLEDVNNWLGRSQFSGDSNSHVTYDEVRLYDHVLTPAQISANLSAGPDAAFPAPTTAADSATLLHHHKVRIPVLANDSGEIVPGSLVIDQPPASGTATVSADGTILYAHTTGSPATDSLIYRVSNTTGQSATGTVTLNFSATPRIAHPTLNVPAAPPPTAYVLGNAFGSLSFSQPVCIASPPGDVQRVFVCEKGGLLRVVTDVTAATPVATTFLNLPSILSSRGESLDSSGESGLLGLAFHPDYAVNRHFFVFYSAMVGTTRYQRVSRFTTQVGNPNAADPGSELILISQLDQANNHNGGDLHFGPDGYLYISVGDEGGGNDEYNNHQTITKDLFAGILRIDIDKRPGSVAPTPHAAIPTTAGAARFSIPADNPFVHTSVGGTWSGSFNGGSVTLSAVRREFYATGLRNPWRMSFDPATGELWCADVGQSAREEVNLIVKGGNYGWAWREGTLNGPKSGAPANFNTLYHTPPIYEYVRTDNTTMPAVFRGNSVTGGIVYRGTRLAGLSGKYVFADYVSGNIWALQRNGTAAPTVERLTGEGGIAGFGRDPSNGDVLLADLDGNRILRLDTSTSPVGYPTTLSATGLFADLTDLSPAPGLVPYEVNLPFWSDHAVKQRWFVVPDGSSRFTASQESPWSLPAGTVWVKHFEMEMQRGQPASRKRIETRVLVKNTTGAYGVSYRWNDAGSEAFLVEDGGVDIPLGITVNGSPAPQTWRIPSRAECMICHTPQAGHALSFNTRQLNLSSEIAGVHANQLLLLDAHGYFTASPGSPNLLPRHLRAEETDYSLEARVRSYLEVNCAYCHKAGGSAPSSWDGRAALKLADTGLVMGTAANNGGDPLNRLLVPGDTARSILLHRIANTGGFTRMPPLGSQVIDTASTAMIADWIAGELASRQTYDTWRTSVFGEGNPQGEPTADPDGDGVINEDEFLAGTSPLSGASALRPTITGAPPQLTFELPRNRSFRIETSATLDAWTPWDVPGNQGLPVSGDRLEFDLPEQDTTRFFRVRVMEN